MPGTLSPEVVRKLRDALARLYPRSNTIDRIATDAGLVTARLDLDGKAVDVWHGVIKEAAHQERLLRLVEIAHEEYPAEPVVAEAVAALRPTPARQTVASPGGTDLPGIVWDLFLAHPHPDAKTAEQLYELLSGQHRVFLDARSLGPGVEWDREIAAALASSRIIVLLISSSYEAAYYARDEVATAIRHYRAQPDARRVVPVFLDGHPTATTPLPYGVGILNGLDAQELGIEGVAQRLHALAAELAGKPLAPLPVAKRPDRVRVLDALSRMLPAMFETVVFRVGIPTAQMSWGTAPQAVRAIELIQYAELGPGLDALVAAIRATAPHLKL